MTTSAGLSLGYIRLASPLCELMYSTMAFTYLRCRWSLSARSLAGRARCITTSRSQPKKGLTLENMNQNVRVMEYAVRGAVPNKAEDIRRRIQEVGEGVRDCQCSLL